MRPGITGKLFLGVLATSVLVAIVMALTGSLGFQRDFRQYIEAAESRRAEALAETLAAIYMETGDWSALGDSARDWRALLRSHARPRDLPPAPEEFGRRPARGALRVALLDRDGRLVVGTPVEDREPLRHPVIVEGETVGWIVRTAARRPTEAADLRFQRAQLRNLGVASIAAVLFAALVAALLSRSFLAPARAIGAASHRLAAGDFSARVEVGSGDEFGRLADDFNLLARTLERNEEVRRHMMADVAHELRTPLAVMRGELDAVEDGVRDFNKETLASLQAETRSLGNLVEDLYQLSLADVGMLDYRRHDLDLRQQLLDALQPMRDRCTAAGIELDLERLEGRPLWVQADPDRLAQLAMNLVENSLRYTDAPGRIEASCRRDGDSAVFELHDSDPGLPAEALPRLFDRFYRAEGSRSRASGGAGLGLAICRNIIEAHGGDIGAAASPLGGLVITVRLPLLRGKG